MSVTTAGNTNIHQ